MVSNGQKKLSKFNEKFIKSYNKNSDEGYFLEVYDKYQKTEIFNLQKDLPFLPEKNRKSQKTSLQYRRQRKTCCPHKCFKTGTKSPIDSRKSTQNKSIQSKIMVGTMH